MRRKRDTASEAGGAPEKKKGNFGIFRILLIAVCAGVFAYSAYSLVTYYRESWLSQKNVDDLKQHLAEATPRPSPTPRPSGAPEPTPSPEPVWEVSGRFSTLYSLNEDLAGWIKIDGTNIDYPVMLVPEDADNDGEDFYLHRNFEGEYDVNGLPYLDVRCEIAPRSDHLIIYGHNMKSKIMFHQLTLYEEVEFWEENQYILFDTVYEEGTYQIFAVFVFNVAGSDPKGFQFHRYINYEDEEEFDAFMEEVYERSLYDTGVEVEFGDKFLTLSTCEYTTWNSRFVVMAKQVG